MEATDMTQLMPPLQNYREALRHTLEVEVQDRLDRDFFFDRSDGSGQLVEWFALYYGVLDAMEALALLVQHVQGEPYLYTGDTRYPAMAFAEQVLETCELGGSLFLAFVPAMALSIRWQERKVPPPPWSID